MRTARQIADRVQVIRARNQQRDSNYMKLIAIRKGDYETVAPGMFPATEFDKPLVANLIDTTARDLAEVMAPLPSFNCTSANLSIEADQKRQDKRASIANDYVQASRLQDQMFQGADRFGSFGFMAYIVEPDFIEKMPVIRVGDVATAFYTKDYRGRTTEYGEIFRAPCEQIAADHPEAEQHLKNKFANAGGYEGQFVEIVRFYDHKGNKHLVMLDPCVELVKIESKPGLDFCPVRVVERPNVTGTVSGQFDDVIWVQVARALVQMYTMNALQQSVEAPLAVPDDVNEIEFGPFAVLQSKNPQQIGRVNLNLQPGLFPEAQILAQEQRTGSRYPEGRSGSIDASIITGQGVQALMGTFDTQVQTFQRLNASALEDVIGMCFKMDEAYWGGVKKSRRIKDNGSPRKYEYVPSKDIDGDHTVDVSYGAIAGLDPNRGLVFLLQALAAKLIAKSTARKSLPVDLNVVAEERAIQLEDLDESISVAMAQLPLAIPMMATQGADPRELVLQISEVRKLVSKGDTPAEAMEKVFAPKEVEQAPVDPMQEAMAAAQGGAGMMPQGGGGASELLMSLAGMTPGGDANLQSTISRRTPI